MRGGRCGPEVGPHHAEPGLGRIRNGSDSLLEPATLGHHVLVGLVDTLPVETELPTVVAAPDAILLCIAVDEPGPSMGTVGFHQPVSPVTRAVQDQVLPQQTHRHRLRADRAACGVHELGLGGDGLPVPAQQVAHRGARTDPGQSFVLFGSQHHQPIP